MHTIVTTKDDRIEVATGELRTVWRAGSDHAAATQVASLHEHVIQLQAEIDRLEVLKRSCECSEEDQCAFARERDESREAARWILAEHLMSHGMSPLTSSPDDSIIASEARERWPWLDSGE